MLKFRLDQELVNRGLLSTRSKAESYIKLGKVSVNNRVVTKSGFAVKESDQIKLDIVDHYVGRAALKLASATEQLKLNFRDKTILDVGSSTGGFTDYALQHGAKKVIAVDVGSNQMDPSLRGDGRVELHEKTDIRDFKTARPIDLVVIDVSFISLREVLPAIKKLAGKGAHIVAMAKPQFEATSQNLKHKGVIKNDTMRRQILRELEGWMVTTGKFKIVDKADSAVSGAKGNKERFYLLKPV